MYRSVFFTCYFLTFYPQLIMLCPSVLMFVPLESRSHVARRVETVDGAIWVGH
jgi:hypothetical protein